PEPAGPGRATAPRTSARSAPSRQRWVRFLRDQMPVPPAVRVDRDPLFGMDAHRQRTWYAGALVDITGQLILTLPPLPVLPTSPPGPSSPHCSNRCRVAAVIGSRCVNSSSNVSLPSLRDFQSSPSSVSTSVSNRL